ncbi:hypothetical protein GLOIN_2v1764523 [Rhizophagus irregularis DAOM 181602=DAOM 197198]|nr:hypothetical protein GLOIN_2v1764523 [Rhizophagus irregularis DAOM 181602=DAOM 197198]
MILKILRKEKIAGSDFLELTKEKFRSIVNGEDITSIKQFTPVFEEISDDDKAFEHCMEDIILKLSNVETMTDANEFCRKTFPGKPRNIKIEYAQNLAQLESTFQTNKKKRTADQAFGSDYFDYIYGIVTTDMQSEIDSLRQRITEFDTRNAELIRQMMEESNRHDARIEKLEQYLDELEKESESKKNASR